jgi:hypothetical protein
MRPSASLDARAANKNNNLHEIREAQPSAGSPSSSSSNLSSVGCELFTNCEKAAANFADARRQPDFVEICLAQRACPTSRLALDSFLTRASGTASDDNERVAAGCSAPMLALSVPPSLSTSIADELRRQALALKKTGELG